jgi:hypothetical protein
MLFLHFQAVLRRHLKAYGKWPVKFSSQSMMADGSPIHYAGTEIRFEYVA